MEFAQIGIIILILPVFWLKSVNLWEIRNIIPMTITEMGELIRIRREFLRLRQEDLEEMSGITSRTIHMIEKGLGNPSLKTLEKIAIVLGMEITLQVKKA